MSFRLFIYYCAVCGGWAALAGWGLGLLFVSDQTGTIGRALIRAMSVGMAVALGLAVVDGLWNQSRRRLRLVALRGLAGAVIGLVVSVPGAFLGQMLVNATGKEGLAVVGWTLTGLLIGTSVGVYDTVTRLSQGGHLGGALRKVLHGTLGGCIGGLLGGALYVLIRGNLSFGGRNPDDLFSSSALGFVVLGVCIGLLVGLAQVILKEAWVRVEAGFRPGRELILTKEEVTIGRAESCDIGLFGDAGIERLHARILQQGHRYVLADAGTMAGTFVNEQRITQPTPLRSGDAIRVGKSVMRFQERQRRTA
jgi:hypothetical protein